MRGGVDWIIFNAFFKKNIFKGMRVGVDWIIF